MEQNLQKFNANQNLLEWSQRIASCRNSGMSVTAWCKANRIPLSTYYNQQRKVFEAAKSSETSEQKPQLCTTGCPPDFRDLQPLCNRIEEAEIRKDARRIQEGHQGISESGSADTG